MLVIAAERADLRLPAQCFIPGLTRWTSLCSLPRGETLKLRELEYIQAAQAFGVADLSLLQRHVLPKRMRLMVIALVMDFSGLVPAGGIVLRRHRGRPDDEQRAHGTLARAGGMVASAFVFTFAPALAASLLADAMRDAFDPGMV